VELWFERWDVREDKVINTRKRVEGSVVRLPEGIRNVHSRDGGVVLDVRYGHMFNLNLVGSKIVELLRRGYSDCQIVDEISSRFEVSRDTVRTDLQEFLESLERHQLLIRNADELP
jgi:hypothetical protein